MLPPCGVAQGVATDCSSTWPSRCVAQHGGYPAGACTSAPRQRPRPAAELAHHGGQQRGGFERAFRGADGRPRRWPGRAGRPPGARQQRLVIDRAGASTSSENTPSCSASRCPCITVRGVRSSWAMSLTIWRRSCSSRSRAAAMALNRSARRPTSSCACTGTRWARSPAPICAAAVARALRGRSARRVSHQPRPMASSAASTPARHGGTRFKLSGLAAPRAANQIAYGAPLGAQRDATPQRARSGAHPAGWRPRRHR